MKWGSFFCLSLGLSLASTSVMADTFIAGSNPAQRPDAPVIQHHVKTPQWYQQALHGVWQPYPPSLRFLENQGAWYTPFNRPGMTGVYDIRYWHQ
jgi:hypothetical protein